METRDRSVELVPAAEQFALERLRDEALGFGIPVAAQALQSQRLARQAERAQRVAQPCDAACPHRLEAALLPVLARADDLSVIELDAGAVEQAAHAAGRRGGPCCRCAGGCERWTRRDRRLDRGRGRGCSRARLLAANDTRRAMARKARPAACHPPLAGYARAVSSDSSSRASAPKPSPRAIGSVLGSSSSLGVAPLRRRGRHADQLQRAARGMVSAGSGITPFGRWASWLARRLSATRIVIASRWRWWVGR
jgi:hypothetical protein